MIIEISIGEAFDRLTILKIKSEKIKDDTKLTNVMMEYFYLLNLMKEELEVDEDNEDFKRLFNVNSQLWDVENKLREFNFIIVLENINNEMKQFNNILNQYFNCKYNIKIIKLNINKKIKKNISISLKKHIIGYLKDDYIIYNKIKQINISKNINCYELG